MLLHDCCSEETVAGEGSLQAVPAMTSRVVMLTIARLYGFFIAFSIVVPTVLCVSVVVLSLTSGVLFCVFYKRSYVVFYALVRCVASVSLNLHSSFL